MLHDQEKEKELEKLAAEWVRKTLPEEEEVVARALGGGEKRLLACELPCK